MFLVWNIVFGFSVCFVISESLRENNFCIESGKTISDSTALMNTTAVDFYIECAIVCGSDLDCTYAVFRANEKTCSLYSAHLARLSGSLTDTVISTRRKELRLNTQRRYTVVTYKYLDTFDFNYVLFDVKACDSVSLDFYQHPAYQLSFRTRIGYDGGKLSYINLQGGYRYATHANPLLFDCTSYKTFWITWNPTAVEFGTGNIVGVNRLIYSRGGYDVLPPNMVDFGCNYIEGLTYWVFVKQDDRCDRDDQK